ncbi:hypothetical protein WJX84_004392, partial [Apatococcus fuscideae]
MPQTQNQDALYFQNRQGYVRLAIQAGKDILPVYNFGQRSGGEHKQIYHVTGIAWLSRALRMTFIFFWGRWYLPIPNRVPVVTVVGDPVRVRQEDVPSQ